MAPVRIFGTDQSTLSEPMTPGSVSKDVIESQQITDVNRALKQTPGVFIREEEGMGLRPNIGLRGTNPDRSKKVTLLEDGVLIGPSPYSAPAAYFTPNMNRVESLNVFRGFTATGIGPNSVGGAIDYRTHTIPSSLLTGLESNFGSFNTFNNVLTHGGTFGSGSYLIHGSHMSSDGFKELDGGGNTGFNKSDLLAKVRINLPSQADRVHGIEARIGYGIEDSDETYLGLTSRDFDSNPNRRYKSSGLDNMSWVQKQYQLRHEIQLSENSLLESAAYHHEFDRLWYRLDRFNEANVSMSEVLRNPDQGNNVIRSGILRGETDSSALGATNGQLVIAGNDRSYFSQGLQTRFSTSFQSGAVEIKPWAFARLHSDEIKRNHTADNYEMTDGQMIRTADPSRQDALNSEGAKALTLALGGDFAIEDLVITPVLRREEVEYHFTDRQNSLRNNQRTSEVYIPGLSLLNRINEKMSGKVSWNKAATIAGLSSDGSEVRENADNYEVELKYIDSENLIEGLFTFFYMDYQNLTGTCTISNGCANSQVGQAFDGGEAIVKGAEVSAAKGFQVGQFFIPLQGNITLISAKFNSSFNSSGSEWGSGQIQVGDPLPYIPQVQYAATLGMEWKNWRQDLTLVYQSKVYDQSQQSNRQEIKGYGIVDWSGSYKFSSKGSVIAKVNNVLSKEYAVAARPFGLRPGMPQAFSAGLRYEF